MSPAEHGRKGDHGLSLRLRRALVFLFVLPSLIAVAAVVGDVISQRHQQAQQARQGRIVEMKLCTTFGQLAALQPPPGDPTKNPSRAYLQAEHATLVRLGLDLGCKGVRP